MVFGLRQSPGSHNVQKRSSSGLTVIGMSKRQLLLEMDPVLVPKKAKADVKQDQREYYQVTVALVKSLQNEVLSLQKGVALSG
uniref:Uncharacterized protein n=1 Tax=Sphaerodactylus townsendi TaxID=933632 RepID=A0ACB8E594_9SAUR